MLRSRMPAGGARAARAAQLALAAALCGAAFGQDEPEQPKPPPPIEEAAKAVKQFGQEVVGLRAGLWVEQDRFGYLGKMTTVPRHLRNRVRPEPIFETFRVALVLKRTAATATVLVRHNEHAALDGDVTVQVTGPDGAEVRCFEWAAPTPEGAYPAGPDDFVTLNKDELYVIDLTPAFFGPPAPADATHPPGPILAVTAAGARRVTFGRCGDYRIRATYRHDRAGTDEAGRKPSPQPVWRGTAASNEVTVRLDAPPAGAKRLAAFARKAADGRKLKVLAATYFGSAGVDEFVAVGAQADGTIVAFGNLYGPAVPATPVKHVVLGGARRLAINEFVGGREFMWDGSRTVRSPIDRSCPNQAGVIVRYTADLREVLGVTRFAWGTACIDHAAVAPDGGLYVSGRSTKQFRALAAETKAVRTVPVPAGHRFGEVFYQGHWLVGDSYVAKLAADASRLQWACVFQGHRRASPLWPDAAGGVSFDIDGVKHLSADGKTLTAVRFDRLVETGPAMGVLAVAPGDRTVLRGGHRLTATGKETWRQPLLLIYDADGQSRGRLYGWQPGLVGHADFRLTAHAGFTGARYAADGSVWLCGWASGEDTVLARMPADLDAAAPRDAFGMDLTGSTGGRSPQFIHLDPKTRQVKMRAVFAAYGLKMDSRGRGAEAPAGVAITSLVPLAGGGLAFAGRSQPFCVQTPGAFHVARDFRWAGPAPGAGDFVAVFDGTFANLMFSSALPACQVTGVCEAKGGLAVVCRSTGLGEDNQCPPTIAPAQGRYGGGRYDGYVMLIEKP